MNPAFIKAALTDHLFGVYGVRQSTIIKVFCAGWEL